MKLLIGAIIFAGAITIAPIPAPPSDPVAQEILAHQLAIEALYRLHDCRSEAVTRDCSGCHL